jgi:ring-1,2-phenylacetyl-CoA epoxidase subunit PaaC
MNQNLIDYIMHLADNSLIMGHRLSEWCGHGPILEVDMALSNIALDDIGAARSLYQYAAQLEGNGKTEDSYPYFRDIREFKNVLLVEQLNGDFADTIARSLIFDAYQFHFYKALMQSQDTQLASIAEKSLKEVTYHLRFSSDWTIRLGDGTDESKQKMQIAIHNLWSYAGELFEASAIEKIMQEQGIAPDIAALKPLWEETIRNVLEEATISYPLTPENGWHHSGGKHGIHSEYMGFILAEMQYMQKTYPGCEW